MEDDRSGQPDRHSPAGYSKLDYGRSWSSQEWKSGAAAHDRSAKPDKISWDAMQQVRPHHEEPLLDGNAQSARYGETIHDGSGKPETVNHQGEANFENFVMGSRSRICEQSQRPSAQQTEKNVERCRVR